MRMNHAVLESESENETENQEESSQNCNDTTVLVGMVLFLCCHGSTI